MGHKVNTVLKTFWSDRKDWFSPVGREQEIKEYASLLLALIWQRQASFIFGALLAAAYFDFWITLVTYGFNLAVELSDQRLGRYASKWNGRNEAVGRHILKRIAFNTVASALAMSSFVIGIAIQQESGGHFTPIFFLFSAALFAAMYTSQMLGILALRLSIYAATFVFIALLDVVRYRPPITSPIWLEFFTMVLVIYFVTDISWQFYRGYQRNLKQMKQIELENERSKAALVIKSQFVAVVSHELRTPLTSIKGSIDLINSGQMGELSPGIKSLLEIAGRNSQRLAFLIDDLLDLQKMEAGEMSFDFEPLDVHEVVQEVVESTAGFAVKLGITVTTDLDDGGARIRGDRQRLNQALQNLLSNALKFSHEGGTVVLRTRLIGSRVRISIHDNGVGIPEGAEDRVFGKFMQVDSSDKRKVGGTGLGLNITKQIAERHNASIDYESELGVGSVFYLEFDRLEDSATETPAQASARAA